MKLSGRVYCVILTLIALQGIGSSAYSAPPDETQEKIPLDVVPEVEVREIEPLRGEPDWTFVVTHGMGGTKRGDRFEELAVEIRQRRERSQVYLLDWSETSTLGFFGLPVPWVVAAQINDVGDLAVAALKKHNIDPARCTLIGESFGNWVNSRIAERWNGTSRMLVFNPAHELGGYPIPDLHKVSDKAWVFHTASVFDTQKVIGHRGLRLQTAEGATAHEQHTFGIRWLRQVLAHGRQQWLLLEPEITAADSAYYAASVETDGDLDRSRILRKPLPAKPEAPIVSN